MEKSKFVVPWALILFAVLVVMKFTVASSMPLWLVFAPIWIPFIFLGAFLIISVIILAVLFLLGLKDG